MSKTIVYGVVVLALGVAVWRAKESSFFTDTSCCSTCICDPCTGDCVDGCTCVCATRIDK